MPTSKKEETDTEKRVRKPLSVRAFPVAALLVAALAGAYLGVFWGDFADDQKLGLWGLIATILVTLIASVWKDASDRVWLDYVALAFAVIPIAALVGQLLVPVEECETITITPLRRWLGIALFVGFWVLLLVGWFAQRREADAASQAYKAASKRRARLEAQSDRRLKAARREMRRLRRELEKANAADRNLPQTAPAPAPDGGEGPTLADPTWRDVVGVTARWIRSTLRP